MKKSTKTLEFKFERTIPAPLRVEENAVGFRLALALSAVSSFVRV